MNNEGDKGIWWDLGGKKLLERKMTSKRMQTTRTADKANMRQASCGGREQKGGCGWKKEERAS